MSDLPLPSREHLPGGPAQAPGNWTHLPYLAGFEGRSLPASWASLVTGHPAALLESGPTGRHTVLVPESPRAWSFGADGRARLRFTGGIKDLGRADALAWLDRWARDHSAPRIDGWPAFQGGLIAALGYELAATFEPVVARASEPALPRAVFLEADEVLIHDRASGELVVALLLPADQAAGRLPAARARARELAHLWDRACLAPAPALAPLGEPVPVIDASLDPDAFAEAARRAQDYIAAGDTYQVNLSTRLELPAPASGLLAYEAVRATNPSPYMGYLRLPGVELVCGSPELLVERRGARLASRPIAGTRPRTGDDPSDGAFARELAADSKERAEHLMLVDLLRNDIGRVAAPGTVRVPEFMAIERYSHVMHLVSQVEGLLPDPAPPPSLILRALFPGGTVTGAPKVRTLQVIAELEPVARGFYTGSVGWIAASGDLCLNIVIRTLTLADGRCHAQAGAGVVADSVPGREHDESLRKALALRLALSRVPVR
jgi:para-aminobenzoate synthetase component I